MIEVERGSGNVFADIGLPNPEEALAKAMLISRIMDAIEKRKLTQVQAAKLLGIDQAKVSALSRGRFPGFSIERLFRLLNALDCDVDVVVKPKPRNRKHARVKVTAKA